MEKCGLLSPDAWIWQSTPVPDIREFLGSSRNEDDDGYDYFI